MNEKKLEFPITHHQTPDARRQCFDGKLLWIWNANLSLIIFHSWRWNKDILKNRKPEKVYFSQTFSERIAYE